MVVVGCEVCGGGGGMVVVDYMWWWWLVMCSSGRFCLVGCGYWLVVVVVSG